MPYLVIREGDEERIVPLEGTDLTVGRSRKSWIRLATDQASRRHCRIVREGETWKVVDEKSANGTYVDEQRVEQKNLADGNVILVGKATLTFREGKPGPAPPEPLETATSRIPLRDRNVEILLNTVAGAAAAENLERFLEDAVDNVIEIAQAERGILFAANLSPLVARDSSRRPLSGITGISRSIPEQVRNSRKAIYLLDTAREQEAVASQSVSIYQLRTVMCAPLRIGERLLGVLYVDNRAKTREFTSTDLTLFEAVTNYLALTMENVRAGQEAKRREADRRQALERENRLLRAALEKRRHLIGACDAMKALYENVRKAAPTDATTLLLGESGTGKEAIAHVLHDLSPRSSAPLVIIDCASIPETLLESELFGFEKGAFTGATAQKPGKFELAHGGTLFLDEIAELSPALQVKLLRALEQRTVTRVGGVEPVKIDVRLVAATNRDLDALARQGGFRQDLYFRLKVITLTLPPLRERGGDILLLADFFLREAGAANNRTLKGFTEEAREAMRLHRWEGNVRELRNRVEQAVILTNNEMISTEDLNLSVESGVFRPLEEARHGFEKRYIVKALERHGHNISRTARSLDISRQYLHELIKKLGISRVNDAEGVNNT